MRKRFSDVSKSVLTKEKRIYENLLSRYPEEQHDQFPIADLAAVIVLETESVLYTFETLFPDIPMTFENVYAMMINMDELLDPISDYKLLQTIRVLFEDKSKISHFRSRTRLYDQLHGDFRLFSRCDSDAPFRRKSSEFLPNHSEARITHIETLLDSSNASRKQINRPYANSNSNETYYYELRIKESREKEIIRVNDNGKFPEAWIGDALRSPSIKPKDPEKLEVDLHSPEYASLAAEIDIKLGTRYYSTQWNKMMFTSLNTSNKFRYDRPNILYGMLGKGKSTFVIMETVRLTKKQGKRVAILTANTRESRQLANTLRKLGISAVPIIGQSNEKEHETRHLSDISIQSHPSGADMFELAREDFVFSTYRGDCLLQITNDNSHPDKHPCSEIRSSSDRNPHLCPLASRCGRFTIESDLPDAEVILLTVPSFLSTKLSLHLDPEQRTYAEWIYSWADVVFFDEADAIQYQLDERFMVDETLMFDEKGRFERMFQEFLKSIRQSRNRHPFIVYQMKTHLDMASDYHMWLRDLMKSSPVLRDYFKIYSTFSLSQELRHIMLILWPDLTEETREQWFRQLYNLGEGDGEEIEAINQFILSVRSIKNQYAFDPDQLFNRERTLLHETLQKISIKMNTSLWNPVKPAEKKRYDRVFFRFWAYIYLTLFQKHFMNAELLEPAIADHFYGIYQDTGEERNRPGVKLLLPFLSPPLTGKERFYQYKTSDNLHNKGAIGTFCRTVHLASGRDVLLNYHRLFESLEGKGPATIMLSGTSYAPRSSYYHLEMEEAYKWLMIPYEEPGQKIEHFSHVLIDSYGKAVSVSGSPDEEKFSRLEQLSRLSINLIHQELGHWEMDASIKHETSPRGVLLAVNSYVQAKSVYNTLYPVFGDQLRYLSRNGTEVGSVSTSTMLQMPGRSRILIAPWTVMNRGYNILRSQSNDAFFGSIMLMIRPFKAANDIEYAIIATNALRTVLRNGIQVGDISKYGEGYRKIRAMANELFRDILSAESGWAKLSSTLKHEIAWYSFINLWQMIGRLLRGNASARVHYLDARFLFNTDEDAQSGVISHDSLLKEWSKMFTRDPISSALYGVFFEQFDQAFCPIPGNRLH